MTAKQKNPLHLRRLLTGFFFAPVSESTAWQHTIVKSCGEEVLSTFQAIVNLQWRRWHLTNRRRKGFAGGGAKVFVNTRICAFQLGTESDLFWVAHMILIFNASHLWCPRQRCQKTDDMPVTFILFFHLWSSAHACCSQKFHNQILNYDFAGKKPPHVFKVLNPTFTFA